MCRKEEEQEEGLDQIFIEGARVHNLKDISVSIPRNKLTVFTGLSGSGKSSLAFDTIYAEGQRRYIETFSAYARQFLGNLERPDVDRISGLSPVIAIEQKTTSKNPRSTVGTITEIYDFLRLLYSRVADAYSYNSGKKMVRYSDSKIISLILEAYAGKKVMILSPVIQNRKGHYKELIEQFRRKGFLNARIDGKVEELKFGMKLDRYKLHTIELIIDKMVVAGDFENRLKESVNIAMKHGKGVIIILDVETDTIRFFSKHLMCPDTGLSYGDPEPHTFSFNSPKGACPRCNGLGEVNEVDIDKIIPDQKKSIRKGAIIPFGPYKNALVFWQLEAIGRKYGFTMDSPIEDIPEDALNIILYGSGETFRIENTPLGISSNYLLTFDGLMNYISRQKDENLGAQAQKWADQFVNNTACPECNGARLMKEALHFRIKNKSIADLASLDLLELKKWLDNVEEGLTDSKKIIAKEVLKEIRNRVGFLIEVGIDYLCLNRSAKTLSGGEAQRIRLATQIGSKLVNVLYILDEPSIGLHQRDNRRLIDSLKSLRDIGNTVLVVEHDREMILSADHIVDIGPYAGRKGGHIVAEGTPETIRNSDGLTGKYISDREKLAIPEIRRKGNGLFLKIEKASGNNLKNVSVDIPLGMMVCITGVSGSGKSTLINETLYPYLSNLYYRSGKSVMPVKSIIGTELLNKVIEVDQNPLGKTPRSNPATYTGVFTDIRKLYESLPESKIRGYKAGRFSFNVAGGRCEGCKGAGVKTIEMNFLPDVYVECDECYGKRYNRETLEVRFKGKSVCDVLDMTINQAAEFFKNIPSIHIKLKTLLDVGMGYIKLGQPSTTLSGGESQRVKLAAELSKRQTGSTLYILDEPTTGLHFEDVRVLMKVLNHLVDKGNTIIIIEHNLDVIKMADHIIDLGPEGGARGGKVIAFGSPEDLAREGKGFTAEFLREELNQ